MDFRRPTALLPGSQPFSKPHFCHGYPLSPDSHRGWPPLFDSNKTWQTRNDKQLTVILEKKTSETLPIKFGCSEKKCEYHIPNSQVNHISPNMSQYKKETVSLR
jgi:hypothetical protein